jgi:hypothetical protein
MKAKTIFIIAFLLLQESFLFSQSISIELSVSWRKGYDIIDKESMIYIPILNITYRNNCDTDYYFLNICETKDSFPNILCLLLDNVHYDEYAQADYIREEQLYGKYVNQTFKVYIGGRLSYGSIWDIDWVSDCTDISSEYVKCYLRRIYSYIRRDNDIKDYPKKNPDGTYRHGFTPEDLLPENCLNSVKEQFVFLKSGETYTYTYNLVAFQLVGGCFTFHTYNNLIENYVLGESEYDAELKRVVAKKLLLPEIVGEYYRYSGAFNTNKVTVCFGGGE